MIDALIFLSQRPIVITLAVLGALLVMAGALIAKPERSGSKRPLARRLTSSGYAITFASIVLFIIAGFVSDLRP
ncbi:MAG: hypothetical protein ACR2P3_09285 [Geminicoccaceae bacterium]